MNEQTWPQWFKANSDKFLLLFACVGFMVYSAHFAHRGDPEVERTALNYAGQAFAGFLTLTTAARLAANAAGGGGSGSAPLTMSQQAALRLHQPATDSKESGV